MSTRLSLGRGSSTVRSSSTGTGQTLLADDSESTDQDGEKFEAKNDTQGDHGADDTSNSLGHTAAAAAAGVGGGARVRAGGRAVVQAEGLWAALARGVAAGLAPVSLVVDGEGVHAGHELRPRERGLARAE